MTANLSRSIALDDLDGRTLHGTAYRYLRPSTVEGDPVTLQGRTYLEQMVPGADRKTLADRGSAGEWPLLVWHSRTTNLGRLPPDEVGAVRFQRLDDRLAFTARVHETDLGDEMLQLVRDGQATDVSVTFRPLGHVEADLPDGLPLVSRTELALVELSLAPTGTGVHRGAQVEQVRSGAEVGLDLDDLDLRLRLLRLA